jgi:hypothetical protein
MAQLPAAAPMPAYKRDPHLPSPEVCDWLLSLKWSKPSTVKVIADDGTTQINDCCRATTAIGRNECIDVVLPTYGIEILQEDAARRQEANGSDETSELEAFCGKVEDLIGESELNVAETMGTFYLICAKLATASLISGD